MAWKVLYIFWRIIGICPFGLKNWRTICVSKFGAFHSIILSLVYFASYTQIAAERTNFYVKHQTTMNKVADVVGHTLEAMLTITVWISFGCRQKWFRTIQKAFLRVTDDCQLLGIHETHSNVIKICQYRAGIANGIWLSFYIADQINPPGNVNRFLLYFFCTCHSILPNIIIFYCTVVILIRDQFRSLNRKLREIVEIDSTPIDRLGRKKRSKTSGIESFVESDPLAFLGRIHTEMVYLSESVISFLSPSLYCLLMLHLVQLSDIAYTLTYAAVTNTFWNGGNISGYATLFMWFVVHMTAMIAEIAIADSATEEANKAGGIIHEALIFTTCRVRRDSVVIWSFRLLQEPLTMDLFGVIQMKYSVIYRILGLTVAYTALLLQMDEEQSY